MVSEEHSSTIINLKKLLIMKKLLLLLALCGVMVACGDDKKGVSKDDVYATFNQMVDALDDETPDNFIKAFKAMDAKYNSASEADKKVIDEATDQWRKENPEDAEKVYKACDMLREQGLL